MSNSVNRRTAIKGRVSVPSAGIPSDSKPEFDPADFVAACDKLQYRYFSHLKECGCVALYVQYPVSDEEEPLSKIDAYMELLLLKHDTEGAKEIIKTYLISIGRTC